MLRLMPTLSSILTMSFGLEMAKENSARKERQGKNHSGWEIGQDEKPKLSISKVGLMGGRGRSKQRKARVDRLHHADKRHARRSF